MTGKILSGKNIKEVEFIGLSHCYGSKTKRANARMVLRFLNLLSGRLDILSLRKPHKISGGYTQ